jgi:hypothetical protein
MQTRVTTLAFVASFLLTLACVSDTAVPGPAPAPPSEDAVAPCPEDKKSCAGQCVPKDDPAYGCALGKCSPCPALVGVASKYCSQGLCEIESCSENLGNCDGDTANGCETSLKSPVDRLKCGEAACKGDRKLCKASLKCLAPAQYAAECTECPLAFAPRAGKCERIPCSESLDGGTSDAGTPACPMGSICKALDGVGGCCLEQGEPATSPAQCCSGRRGAVRCM